MGLVGRTIREAFERRGLRLPTAAASATRGKHETGDWIEQYFGIVRNNDPSPDFADAGVELKTVPLTKRSNRLQSKERTSISQIDYMTLVHETWANASVRKKLDRILFIFVDVRPADKLDHVVRGAYMWTPNPLDEGVLERDWWETHRFVKAGRAHELSERIAFVLAPARKGSGKGKDSRQQPNSAELAPQRAFALKPSYTSQLFAEHVQHQQYTSAFALVAADNERSFEAALLARLRDLEGRTIADVAAEAGLSITGGKSAGAKLVRSALGIPRSNARLREVEQLGLEIKTLNLRPDLSGANEATSFPAMVLQDFAAEEWADASLRDQLRRILFIPLLGAKGTPQAARVVGRSFAWSPSEHEWAAIEREWRTYQRLVNEGAAAYRLEPTKSGKSNRRRNGLPGYKETEIIHMRPHGLTSADEDVDPLGNRVTKQSFWLNPAFVAALARDALTQA